MGVLSGRAGKGVAASQEDTIQLQVLQTDAEVLRLSLNISCRLFWVLVGFAEVSVFWPIKPSYFGPP